MSLKSFLESDEYNSIITDDLFNNIDNNYTSFENVLNNFRNIVYNEVKYSNITYDINIKNLILYAEKWYKIDIKGDIPLFIMNRKNGIKEKFGDAGIEVLKLFKCAIVMKYNVYEYRESFLSSNKRIFIDNCIVELAQFTGILFYVDESTVEESVESIKNKIMEQCREIILVRLNSL